MLRKVFINIHFNLYKTLKKGQSYFTIETRFLNYFLLFLYKHKSNAFLAGNILAIFFDEVCDICNQTSCLSLFSRTVWASLVSFGSTRGTWTSIPG